MSDPRFLMIFLFSLKGNIEWSIRCTFRRTERMRRDCQKECVTPFAFTVKFLHFDYKCSVAESGVSRVHFLDIGTAPFHTTVSHLRDL